jgi:AraC-like DNA-binding protein
MSYREHAPGPLLAPWLECIWERRGRPGPPLRVLPDGCIDIVWTSGAGAQLVGANTTAFLVPLTADVRVVGARMLPGCAPALLGVAAEQVRDARMPAGDVLGDRGARLEHALDGDEPVAALRALLQEWVGSASLPDPLVREAVLRLERRELAIAELAGELGVSERGLRRRVTAAVGYGPRRLARILRLGRALRAARTGDGLARVAFEAGYTDQSHFTNDCTALAGVPPSVVLAGWRSELAVSSKTPA